MLVLVRDIRKGDAVLGCLFLNGTFIFYTLENADKDIPEGIYNIENSKSPKFKRELPLIYNQEYEGKPWHPYPSRKHIQGLAWLHTCWNGAKFREILGD